MFRRTSAAKENSGLLFDPPEYDEGFKREFLAQEVLLVQTFESNRASFTLESERDVRDLFLEFVNLNSEIPVKNGV